MGRRAYYETAADCGSLLLGSRYTPYLDERARAACRASGCTAFEYGAGAASALRGRPMSGEMQARS